MPRRQSIVDTPPARPARRAQADRTAGTRAALEQATIDLLIERGWAAVTAIEVCNRASVSRGAFHHHYTSLPQLLADALKRLYAEMRDEDRPPAADLGRLIDATWRHISSPRFKAVLEAWLAMANDSSLDSEIGPVVAEFSNLVSPANATTPTLADESDRALYLMARETLLGLALGRATNRGRPLGHEQTVLTQLRRIADHGIQAR